MGGYGDNEPPALRAEPFPATLAGPGGFRVLVLSFIRWDVIKLTVSVAGQPDAHRQFDSGRFSTDSVFQPSVSGALHRFVARGCSRALDGSTNFCSPPSSPVSRVAATNTNSVRDFLIASGVSFQGGVSLRAHLPEPGVSLRTVMGL
jgi:hypothetical protein